MLVANTLSIMFNVFAFCHCVGRFCISNLRANNKTVYRPTSTLYEAQNQQMIKKVTFQAVSNQNTRVENIARMISSFVPQLAILFPCFFQIWPQDFNRMGASPQCCLCGKFWPISWWIFSWDCRGGEAGSVSVVSVLLALVFNIFRHSWPWCFTPDVAKIVSWSKRPSPFDSRGLPGKSPKRKSFKSIHSHQEYNFWIVSANNDCS